MSKIELSPWQNPEDGFPTDAYQDAVCVALEEAGVGVDDGWRDEPYDFVIKLDRAAYADGPLEWATHGVYIGWRASEECDPLSEEGMYGFSHFGPGWHWVPYSKHQALGDFCEELCTSGTKDQVDPFAEPADVAEAVKALISPEPVAVPAVTADGSDQEAAKEN